MSTTLGAVLPPTAHPATSRAGSSADDRGDRSVNILVGTLGWATPMRKFVITLLNDDLTCIATRDGTAVVATVLRAFRGIERVTRRSTNTRVEGPRRAKRSPAALRVRRWRSPSRRPDARSAPPRSGPEGAELCSDHFLGVLQVCRRALMSERGPTLTRRLHPGLLPRH
jgi:hypothetical protein